MSKMALEVHAGKEVGYYTMVVGGITWANW